ncbi:hypothetical protein B0T16DRAFT_452912 [Cercophora newfieldiana]|uniref:Glycoside hydrolase family 76 protein n=1 Tax=Cercophora newfieldiana TaxID=92897 RepID=A0AA39YRU9_9PEZI|nr:hypothetical protein B0T16DRAFT_452912 [Cercophora newfieldiana]
MFVRWGVTLLALAVAVNAAAVPPRPQVLLVGNSSLDTELFGDTLDALRVMQNEYFESWIGTWPTAIDWTAAVMGTQVAGALYSLSEGFEALRTSHIYEFSMSENLISLYFTQLVSFYFGQDALSLRAQAYDDMLWVVLGWLDAIKFAKDHSKAHFEAGPSQRPAQGWYGTTWFPAFAHRARIFWHLASVGWDTKLCGGGMNWNPRLMPYKNAITNELYISASTAMYLHFPGDDNSSPFIAKGEEPELALNTNWPPHDPKYRIAALDGHRWLQSSNMTNRQGLYVDGFHISGYKPGDDNSGKKCDERDEMVYTYNQGVLLTGLRHLYTITGEPKYLEEGQQLIRSTIRATGWNIESNLPFENPATAKSFPPWHGLGRAGVLEDACDASGTCSQDAQTFKGIWMHHFTTFCIPLVERLATMTPGVHTRHVNSHIASCKEYEAWLRHNVNAARNTKDRDGKFGMWWTAGLLRDVTAFDLNVVTDVPKPDGATDYRNEGVPNTHLWVLTPTVSSSEDRKQRPMTRKRDALVSDVNDRGRGRTVETQSGGLALLRALWEISRLP